MRRVLVVAVAAATSGEPACTTTALSDEQVAAYRRDGFVVVPTLLQPDEVALVQTAIEQDESLNDARWTISLNDDRGGRTRLNIWSYAGNSTLGHLTRSRRVVGAMRQLLGGEVKHYHSKTLIKKPGQGGEWNWHQDYGYVRPALVASFPLV